MSKQTEAAHEAARALRHIAGMARVGKDWLAMADAAAKGVYEAFGEPPEPATSMGGNSFAFHGIKIVEDPTMVPDEFHITHAPIFVSKTQLLEWRKEWMADHPAADGEDHVTPFDGLLYQHVPYDKHAQRLRSACSNIKWSEVPLAKLEGIAAVLCEYGS